jgi:hypothetical protein
MYTTVMMKMKLIVVLKRNLCPRQFRLRLLQLRFRGR